MWIRLIKKLALMLNGIDLTYRQVGEVFALPAHDAEVVIREGWAEPIERRVSAGRRKTDGPSQYGAPDLPVSAERLNEPS